MEATSRPSSRNQSEPAHFIQDREQQTPTDTTVSSTSLEFETQLKPDTVSPDVIPETQDRASSRGSEEGFKRGPNNQPPQIKLAAEWTAAELSPAPNNVLLHELGALVLKLLNKGIQFKEILETVNQTGVAFSHQFNQVQSDAKLPQGSTTGLIKHDPHLEEGAAALAPDHMHGSQYGNKSASREATGHELPDVAEISSRLPTPNGDGLFDQIVPQPVSDEPNETDTALPNRAGRKKHEINDEFEFSQALKAHMHGCESITVGGSAIQLIDLAKNTINVNRQNKERTTTDEETWQLLYNIIANILVSGPDLLYDTIKAMGQPAESNARHQPPPTDKLRLLAQSMCSWAAEDNKPALSKLYSHYDKLQTVYLYDAMMKPENERGTKALLERNGIYLGWGKKKIPAAIRDYILKWCGKQGVRTTDEKLARQITEFKPVCHLVEAFGQGVLVLLGNGPLKLLDRVFFAAGYPKQRRLRDVVMSLRKADRISHNKQLHALFVELQNKVLRPALDLRAHQNTGGWLIDCPLESLFERKEFGERIWFVLRQITRTNACSDSIPTQAQHCSLKRRRSCSGKGEAAQGGWPMKKRNNAELNEDGRSSKDESEVVPA